MADIQIIGGRTGSPHIDIYEVSALFRSLIGGESYYAFVTEENDKLQPRVVNSNEVAVQPGGLYLQGSYMRVPLGQVGDVDGALIEGQTKAVLYVEYEQDQQTGVDSAEFKIYNGNYESYISDNPVSRLENSSKNIKASIYEITYSTLGGQAQIASYALTPDCKDLISLFTNANQTATNSGGIVTNAAAIQALTTALAEMSNRLNSYKKVCSGIEKFENIKEGVTYNHTVSLPANLFSSEPKIFLNPFSSAPQQVTASVGTVKTNYFQLYFHRVKGNASTSVQWLAVED